MQPMCKEFRSSLLMDSELHWKKKSHNIYQFPIKHTRSDFNEYNCSIEGILA